MQSTSRRTVAPAFTAVVVLFSILTSAQSPTFTTITGEIGPGSSYEIDMPAGPWNGELVVFLQGPGDPNEPVELPNAGMLRSTLTSQGFALAYTSRSVNGYGGVKDGFLRTHQLRGVFTANVGQPARTYLVGRSLGALIAVMLVERFPDQYDGAVAGSGLLGGGLMELIYLADARVLFDYYFPGVLSGSWAEAPADEFAPGDPLYERVLATLQEGLLSPGQPTLQFACAAHLPAANNSEIVSAGMAVIGFQIVQGEALMELTNGHMMFDNTTTSYSACGGDDAALNAGVQRFVGEPSAVEYMEHYYTPTGDLHIPLITLHKTRDPLVPFWHEETYAGEVDNAGVSQYLLQRAVVGFGHGVFPAGVEMTAFTDLVQWVHTGLKPQN